ncbi:glycoside hydrolase family 31 protein [Periconia macrospinosa]|uniref:alpha-glucosidase n=1 Tax=Periconia macrospinosa TaxID=97972 RepID=A0A2V1DZ98_9PLEO|nr:glycoside hydrolase family 31 protein [Periconia macrospinosa]
MAPAAICRASGYFISQLACRALPEQFHSSLAGILDQSKGASSETNWGALMAPSGWLKTASVFLSLQAASSGQSVTSSAGATVIGNTTTSFRPTFTIPASADKGADLLPNIKDPEAVNAQDVCPGYKATQVEENERGITAVLRLAGDPCNVYGTDVEVLNLKVEYQADDRLAVSIQPSNIDASNSSWFITPEDIAPRPKLESSANELDLNFEWDNSPSFWFKITRDSTGDVLFTTENQVLVYEDQFIEFVTALPEDYNLSGLGEHIHALRLHNNWTATIYAADVGDPIDRNLYGSHPFYLDTRYFEVGSGNDRKPVKTSQLNQEGQGGNYSNANGTGNSTNDGHSPYESYVHGVYLRNVHGQEIKFEEGSITWRLLGGSIDLFFYAGPTQAEVTQQYLKSIDALPAMQSYWTLGFHLCRWGYRNWTEAREVVETMRAFNIPLETFWLDIDYMDQYRDFTLDPVSFPPSGVKEFFDFLSSNNQHFVPIVDAAIYIPNPQNASDAYDTYARGNESGVFLTNPDGSQYIGAVWPGYTVFPDWLSKKSQEWWINEVVEWHKEVPFSGLWIDMNEVSSFCVGSCGTGNVTLNPAHPPFSLPGEVNNIIYEYPEYFNVTNATEAASASAAKSSQDAIVSATAIPAPSTTSYLRTTPTPGVRNINHPPYVINHVQAGADLAVHAVSPNATHANGVQEYDVHNVWGHQILNATYQALLKTFPSKRPFIIGRSTFSGSGKWAGHWGGDNASKWAYMYFSIPQALSFSLFGIPMFGVDTCGFNGNTDAELCARWMQLSAFFPFYRNHNTLSALSQEPYRWESVASASRTAMEIRYTLLPYIYTLLHASSTTGSTTLRALSWEFPTQPSLVSTTTQFLLGPSLLITPVLAPGATTVSGVFPDVPRTTWYDWYTGSAISAQPGENKTIDAPLGHIPVFVRGGSVVPLQGAGYTTTEGRKKPWSVLVALDKAGEAEGSLYVDDGEALDPGEEFLEVGFEVGDGELEAKAKKGSWRDEVSLGNVTVFGVTGGVAGVSFNGVEIEGGAGGNGTGVTNGTSAESQYRYDEEAGVLRVTGLTALTRNGTYGGDGWRLSWK